MDRLLSGSGNTVPWLSALHVFCSRAAHFTEHSLLTDIDSEGLACGYLSSARSEMEVLKTSTLIMGSGAMTDTWLTLGYFDDGVPVRATQQGGDHGIEAVLAFYFGFFLLLGYIHTGVEVAYVSQ